MIRQGKDNVKEKCILIRENENEIDMKFEAMKRWNEKERINPFDYHDIIIVWFNYI